MTINDCFLISVYFLFLLLCLVVAIMWVINVTNITFWDEGTKFPLGIYNLINTRFSACIPNITIPGLFVTTNLSETTDKVGTCGNDLYNLGESSVLYISLNKLNISTPVLNEDEEPVNVISINLNNFNEISMLNTSPSSGNLSKPDLPLSKDLEVENTCISNFVEPSYFDSSINEKENNNDNNDPFSTLKNIRISFINQLNIPFEINLKLLNI